MTSISSKAKLIVNLWQQDCLSLNYDMTKIIKKRKVCLPSAGTSPLLWVFCHLLVSVPKQETAEVKKKLLHAECLIKHANR